MKPYPWNSRRTFGDRMALVRATRPFAIPLVLLSVLGNPLTILVHLWCFLGFKYFNDRWSKRGLISSAVGAFITLVAFTPSKWVNAAKTVLYAPGDKATKPFAEAIPDLMMASLGPSVILAGLASLIVSFQSEWEERRYLEPTKPTLRMRARSAINRRALGAGKAHKGYAAFGTIVDDPMPWRTPRYGMVVERPIGGLGHGCITGANGTGKTVAGLAFAHSVVKDGASLLMIDCKGSIMTKIKLQNIARDLGVPFQSFDMTPGSNFSTSYDALDWEGSPSEKMSMLMGAFSFPTEGPASHYTDLAKAWLTLQLAVLDEVGVRDGESKFDFLLDTCTPARLKERVAPLRDGNPRQKNLYEKWSPSIAATKADHLSGLRSKLESVVNAAGPRLRPSEDGAPAIQLRSLDERPSIIHIGLSAVTDNTALKVLGSLTIKDLSVFAGERFSGRSTAHRDIVVMPDEASRLGDRTEVMDDVFTLAREARIWVWPITQSFSTWPENTVTEMVTNALTQVVCRLPDKQTAEALLGTLGERRVLNDMREERVRHRMFRSERVTSSADSRSTVTTEPFLPASALTNTADQHAYIWGVGAAPQPTRKKWKPRRLKDPDENTSDTPLVRIVPPAIVLEDDLVGDDSLSQDVGFNDDVQQFNPGNSQADTSPVAAVEPNDIGQDTAATDGEHGWDTGNTPPTSESPPEDNPDDDEDWQPPGWDTDVQPQQQPRHGAVQDSITEELTPEQAAQVAAVREDRKQQPSPKTGARGSSGSRKAPTFVVKRLDATTDSTPTGEEPRSGQVAEGGQAAPAPDGDEWADDGQVPNSLDGAPEGTQASDVSPGWDSDADTWADDGQPSTDGGDDDATPEGKKGQEKQGKSDQEITPADSGSGQGKKGRGGKPPKNKGTQADYWSS